MDASRPKYLSNTSQEARSKQQAIKTVMMMMMMMKQPRQQKPAALSLAASATLIAISVSILALQSALAEAQSTKGRQQNSYAAPSPVTQLRQQQSYAARPQASSTPSTTSSSLGGPTVGTKRKQPIVQQQQQQQQPPQTNSYSSQRVESVEQQANTEDPLSDSEPALYGSVAGAPGVDFPAYTRIPKTSFTCEGKGFDFGFYADEEAQCQVYHVCWSGRRESFLCGVGTVFNQAILACDYWHSVDCSKSSQFYGVNSELGKASAEPASGGSQRIQPARSQASPPPAPASQSSYNYGSPVNQRRQQQPPVQQVQQQQQQQQQYSSDSDANFEPQAQLTTGFNKSPASKPTFGGPSQPASKPSQSYEFQQRVVHSNVPVAQLDTKGSTPRQPPLATTTTTLATPLAAKTRPRFNMDFNQKVNSLIDSPVRPPIKQQQLQTPTSPAVKQRQVQRKQEQQQQPANFAQLAVSRAQQSGSQTLNPGPSRKNLNSGGYQQQQQQQQVIQSNYDNDLDGPQQQQQQQQSAFDDSPVQTSTANYAINRQVSTQANALPQQQQQTIISGGGPDGSSAITTQYDTLTQTSNGGNQNNAGYTSNINESGPADNSDAGYESSPLTGNDDSSISSEDFRSAGAKAAASHNQNWYIMRTI